MKNSGNGQNPSIKTPGIQKNGANSPAMPQRPPMPKVNPPKTNSGK